MQSIFSKEMCLFHVYSLLFSLLLNKNFWEDKLLIWFKFSVLWIDSAVGMVNLWVTFFRGCATILTIIPGIALSNYMLRMSSWQRCSGADEWLPQWLLHILQVKSTCLRSRTERGRNGIPTQGPVVSTAMLLCNGSGMAARFLSGCCGLVAQSCLTLHDPMDCSPPGSSVHGISQATILEWVAIPFSKGSSRPRDQTHVSCIGRWILSQRATWEALGYSQRLYLATLENQTFQAYNINSPILAKWLLKIVQIEQGNFCLFKCLLYNHKCKHGELKSGKFFLTWGRLQHCFLFWLSIGELPEVWISN